MVPQGVLDASLSSATCFQLWSSNRKVKAAHERSGTPFTTSGLKTSETASDQEVQPVFPVSLFTAPRHTGPACVSSVPVHCPTAHESSLCFQCPCSWFHTWSSYVVEPWSWQLTTRISVTCGTEKTTWSPDSDSISSYPKHFLCALWLGAVARALLSLARPLLSCLR